MIEPVRNEWWPSDAGSLTMPDRSSEVTGTEMDATTFGHVEAVRDGAMPLSVFADRMEEEGHELAVGFRELANGDDRPFRLRGDRWWWFDVEQNRGLFYDTFTEALFDAARRSQAAEPRTQPEVRATPEPRDWQPVTPVRSAPTRAFGIAPIEFGRQMTSLARDLVGDLVVDRVLPGVALVMAVAGGWLYPGPALVVAAIVLPFLVWSGLRRRGS